jgi:hypothetical protein
MEQVLESKIFLFLSERASFILGGPKLVISQASFGVYKTKHIIFLFN